MTEFEYIVGLHTIVLGLATAKILTTLSDTLKYREAVTGYWVHSLWCVIVQLNIVGYWYALWRMQAESTHFGYAEFLGYFSLSIALYVMSSFLSFELDGDKVDLQEHFSRVKVPTFLCLMYIFVFFAVIDLIGNPVSDVAETTGIALLDLINVFALPMLIGLGLWFKQKRAQEVIVVLYAVAYLIIEVNQAGVGGT